MAGLIKKQILKHLSRFAKNLSPDKINLSTLKGEGQLTNLELDEEVLQSMLDLPTWLAINKVGCNKAAIRIPWTKLKTHPISLTLDKVVMEMSTCDEPRPPNGPSPIATASGQSEYGFAEKVVEGISLSINSIVVKISAKAFNASFELSQLQVYSVNTSWSLSDLRFTRIQDPHRGEILTFKEISWQMIRIEADAIQSAQNEMLSAPIRLITNQSKIRVTLKRRSKDCNVVASKLILILDDLLWVLTDSQLKAMVQYAKSLSEAMDKSAQQRKSMATEDQESSAPPSAQQVRSQQVSSGTAADQSATMANLFTAFDVCETSHHLQITHLDLHICDDIHAKDRVINKRITGGAMQLSFSHITLDYYPSHRAGESCLHWMQYSEATKAREGWASSLLEEFKSNVEMLKTAKRDREGLANCHTSPQHGKISTSSTSILSSPQTPKTQLLSSSIVLRIADFSIYQVSTADQRRSSPKAMISCNKKSLYLPPEMPAIHVEFTEYYFPDGKDYPIPCPNLYVQLNALQLVLDPRSLVWCNLFALDLRQSLEQFMELYKLNDEEQKPDEHIDIRVDGLMLKLLVPTDRDPSYPQDLPRSVSVQCSEMVATNTRHPPNCSRSHLEALLLSFQEQQFFSTSFTSFPRSSTSFPVIHPVFQRHAHEQDTMLHNVYKGLVSPSLGVDALKMPAATDLWAVHFAQFWVDYEGTRGGKGRPQPFVDAFPLTLWTCQPVRHAQHQERLMGGASRGQRTPLSAAAGLARSEPVDTMGRLQRKRLLKEYYSTVTDATATEASLPPSNGLHKPLSLDNIPPPSSSSSSSKEADMHMLVHVQKHLSAQVSHRQYMFLMRLQRSIKALQHTLQQDLEGMGSKRDKAKTTSDPSPDHQPFSACVGILLKSAEVALLLKPVPQPEGPGSPLVSELSPSESRCTLETGSDGGEGGDRGTHVEGAGTKGSCTVDQLMCGGGVEGGITQGPAPLIPASAPNLKASLDERTGRSSSKELGEASLEARTGGEEPGTGVDCKAQQGESSSADPTLSDPLSTKDWNEKNPGARLPESMSRKGSLSVVSDWLSSSNTRSTSLYSISNIGRLMRERSQSSFSVSYKNMKKTPSLQSLDNLSIDSYLMEDGDTDTYSLLERDDVSISGFKDVVRDQSATEIAKEAAALAAMGTGEQDGAGSPDTVSATSQSIDEPTKDMVSVLVLKVQCVCGGMEVRGESTTVSLEVGCVRPTQLGNVSLRQYLSNRSLGMVPTAQGSTIVPPAPGSEGGGLEANSDGTTHLPEVRARLESGPCAAAHSPLAETNGFLQLRLHGYRANFLMSSLRNLAHFLEDDSAPQVLPMEISVRNTHIDLKDDGPRDNPSDPDPTPITLHISNLLIHRTDDGAFSIGVENTSEAGPKKEVQLIDSGLSPVPESVVSSTPKATQTPSPPSPSTTPSNKEQLLIEENECLKLELSKAKMALAEAQMEKDSLLHRMKSLKVNSS
ncbi:bridge-like lipid transfer protein family member 3B isoform X1 [Salvelinus fontinalis]|uniref:bridge-like lipid transfer protein family member 3B isoform X1 n=1 Tax=Salvelinus fontinalis TaxID=8038 RepID=UPI002485149F|nr:bridge-like lipid transfer protein family member 3B isoform X1 [Salvelinus fontinalis]